MVTAGLIVVSIGAGFVAGALYEHLRHDGSRDLAARLRYVVHLHSVGGAASVQRARELIERGLSR
jgi:hypothetical protein